jgi:pimeloyl-ACP methyl ester carboxylesterase
MRAATAGATRARRTFPQDSGEVIAVDQRGIGRSDKPASGYDTGPSPAIWSR